MLILNFFLHFRNMVIQNEAVDADDDLEHFEDITENDSNEDIPGSDSNSRSKKVHVAETIHASDDDNEESLQEDGFATSDSEDVNDTDDLFGKGGFDKALKSKSADGHQVRNQQCPTPTPGGYNPRHREPSYW